MSEKVASILAEIGLDGSKFATGANTIGGLTKGLINTISGLNPVIGVAVSAFGLLIDQVKECESAANESARASAKMNAVIASTNGAAGMTANELNALSDSISKSSGLDDELVTSAEAVMLTFTKLGGDIFPSAMQAASDMSAVLGQDLQSSVTMIGKAMNDFSGYTALKRAGVSFTQEQIKQIANFKDTNDLVGYQNLLLKELQTEYGGAATAIEEASDKSDALKVSQENLKEAMGREVVPAVRKWNEILINVNDTLAEHYNAVADYQDKLESLGISYNYAAEGGGRYGNMMRDGVRITKEQADAMIEAANAADIAADRYDKMSPAIEKVGDTAALTDEQLQDLTDTNKTMISMTEQFVDITKMSAEEAEIATHKIVLGYLEQQLAQDGLSTAETEFLLQKGVEWGIYSDTAIASMRAAMAEANNLAAAVNGIPSSKSITITTITQSLTSLGTSSSVAASIAAGVASGEGLKHRASGGPTDGLTLVGENGPEMVNLPGGSYVYNNPQTQQMMNSDGIIAAIHELAINMKLDYAELTRSLDNSGLMSRK